MGQIQRSVTTNLICVGRSLVYPIVMNEKVNLHLHNLIFQPQGNRFLWTKDISKIILSTFFFFKRMSSSVHLFKILGVLIVLALTCFERNVITQESSSNQNNVC